MNREFDFDRGEIAARYDRGRGLPAATVHQWLDEITAHLPPGAARILDLGCGTGRFTTPLAARFHAMVCGLDRSAKMLAIARRTLHSPAVLVQGSAETLPFGPAAFDAVLVSMVLHHIRLQAGALDEIRRVMRPDGTLIVRTSSIETMDSYLWASFFPEAARIEASRVLPRQAIAVLLADHGFTLQAHPIVDQVFAADLAEYCVKIGQRALSSLAAIPDTAFDAGIAALRQHCRAAETAGPVCEPVDLFVFRSQTPPAERVA